MHTAHSHPPSCLTAPCAARHRMFCPHPRNSLASPPSHHREARKLCSHGPRQFGHSAPPSARQATCPSQALSVIGAATVPSAAGRGCRGHLPDRPVIRCLSLFSIYLLAWQGQDAWTQYSARFAAPRHVCSLRRAHSTAFMWVWVGCVMPHRPRSTGTSPV